MKQLIKKTLSLSTIYYTVAVIAFSAIMMFSHSSESTLSLDPTRIMYVYPFCLSFAIANVILKHTDIQIVWRWVLHFALTVIGAYLFIILPADLGASSGNFMGLMIIFALYAVGALVTMLFSKRIKNAIREDKEIKQSAKSQK